MELLYQEDDEPGDPTTPSPGQLTALQIQQMMADAKRMISVRKQALEATGISLGGAGTVPPPSQSAHQHQQFHQHQLTHTQMSMAQASVPPHGVIVPPPINRNFNENNNNPAAFDGMFNIEVVGGISKLSDFEWISICFPDKKKKIAELQAQIASKLASGGFKPDEEPTKPIPLLLDSEGRPIDVSGKQLLFPTRQPTLKANIRAQKRTGGEHKPILKEGGHKPTPMEGEEDDFFVPNNKYFDERLAPASIKKGVSGLDRKRKAALRFKDPGYYVAVAQKQRTEARLHNLKAEIADKARKTGIANAARMAKLSGTAGTSGDKGSEYIPQVEWWDSIILEESEEKKNKSNPNQGADLITYDSLLKKDAITNLIEHPTQMKCPTDPNEPHCTPVFLTKKEQKKLRRQNRRETWKEKQEKIRLGKLHYLRTLWQNFNYINIVFSLGLEPPPPPKVRISNLMRVLGTEAVQDPTKVEAHVRQQMAKRLKTHQDSNAARKLTPDQKKAKKVKKMQEDVSLGVSVSVYRIDCLGSQAKR